MEYYSKYGTSKTAKNIMENINHDIRSVSQLQKQYNILSKQKNCDDQLKRISFSFDATEEIKEDKHFITDDNKIAYLNFELNDEIVFNMIREIKKVIIEEVKCGNNNIKIRCEKLLNLFLFENLKS